MLVSTLNEVAGYRVVRHIGLVRGITVRSRSVVGNFFGNVQSFFGGRINVYVHLAETARQEALDHLCQHAREGGANAVIGMRYDANEITDGITEVLAYGTAVVVEPAGDGGAPPWTSGGQTSGGQTSGGRMSGGQMSGGPWSAQIP